MEHLREARRDPLFTKPRTGHRDITRRAFSPTNYQNTGPQDLRTHALDRFGAVVAQRFSREEFVAMMESSGLPKASCLRRRRSGTRWVGEFS